MMDIHATLKRWKARATEIDPAEFEVLEHDEEALADAFIRDLEFGTAGLRGIIGAGSNRMNVYTVAQATQGLANYLNRTFDNPSVAIARDSRNMGEEFCKISAGVLAANGIRALLYPRIEPTPALSFAVRDLHCSAGICMTASHNRAEYNGYKVYGPDGCQITTQAAKDIQSEIGCVDIFDDVSCMDFEEGIDAGLISWIGDDTIDRFIDCCGQASLSSEKGPLSVVYTPLHGTGLECVTKILERIGGSDLIIEPNQAIPDGDFPTCPYPNPEVREALERGLALAEEKQADLLLATDPDADRVGIAVVKDGEPVLLTGNETGILLTDYICTMLAEKGYDLKDKVVISTIVSSTMLDELCNDRGFELRRTLTGFKYIGEQIGYLEAEGQADRYAFGFEESYGYLAGTHVRDKDAVVTSMLICEMARWYRAKGMDLIDALDALYAKYGFFENAVVSFGFTGSDGVERMADVLTRLRAERPTQIANLAVLNSVDYEPGIEMPIMGGKGDAAKQLLPSANVLEYALEGQSKLIIRPSGTEPKIKVYVFAKGATKEESARTLTSLKEAAGELLA